MIVGMDRIPAVAASSWSASVLTLACTTSGCAAADRSSKTGANARHGPHQDAQKSTSTIGLSAIVDSKSA